MKTLQLSARGAVMLLPLFLSITFTHAQPVAVAEGRDINFDSVFVGSGQWPLCLTIENAGDEPLEYQVSSSNPVFTHEHAGMTVVIPPGESSIPCMSFLPVTTGLVTGTITITTNDPNNSVIVYHCSGIGIDAPFAESVLQDTLTEGTASTKQFLLRNTTLSPVEYFVVSMEDFMSIPQSVYYLLPGETAWVEVNFDATGRTPGTYTGMGIMGFVAYGSDGYPDMLLPISMTVEPSLAHDFILTNFKTGEEIDSSGDTLTVDIARPDLAKLTIQYKSYSEYLKGVRFTLNGALVNTDKSSPYYVNHWVIPNLGEGFHTLSAQEFLVSHNVEYVQYNSSVVIHVINSAAITDFDVVSSNGTKLMDLENGTVIDIGQAGFKGINIVANTSINSVRSVRFLWGQNTARIDNRSPYALKGNPNGSDTFWPATPGSYTLTATPYMQYYGWGPAGQSLTINFEVIQSQPAVPSARSASENEEVLIEESLSSEDLWIVYPVPVKDELTIALDQKITGDIALTILNGQGQSVYRKHDAAETFRKYTISTTDIGMNQGIYFVVLQQNNGNRYVKKIIKE